MAKMPKELNDLLLLTKNDSLKLLKKTQESIPDILTKQDLSEEELIIKNILNTSSVITKLAVWHEEREREWNLKYNQETELRQRLVAENMQFRNSIGILTDEKAFYEEQFDLMSSRISTLTKDINKIDEDLLKLEGTAVRVESLTDMLKNTNIRK